MPVGRPFKPGQSGNPNGRPKAAAGLRDYLKKKFGSDGRVLVDRLTELMQSPDDRVALNATELCLAYLAGKPVSQHEVAGMDGQDIGIRVTFGGRYKPNGDAP